MSAMRGETDGWTDRHASPYISVERHTDRLNLANFSNDDWGKSTQSQNGKKGKNEAIFNIQRERKGRAHKTKRMARCYLGGGKNKASCWERWELRGVLYSSQGMGANFLLVFSIFSTYFEHINDSQYDLTAKIAHSCAPWHNLPRLGGQGQW